MISEKEIREKVEKMMDDDAKWSQFVKWWMETYPVDAFEIVSGHLDSRVNEIGWNHIQDEWMEWLREDVVSRYEDAMERKRDEEYEE